jgi:hypothetical protein
VRVGPWPLAQTASGAALDRDCTLWLSGGNAINRVGLDGRLIERFALEPRNSLVQSRTFATLKDTLYFLGKLQTGKLALFELPMRSGATAKALPVSMPEHKRPHLPPCVAPQPLNGQLVILAEPKEFQDARIAVYFYEPGATVLRTAFELTGEYPHGVAVDAQREVIYIGANFGQFVGGETHSAVYGINAVRPDGQRISPEFPVPCPKTPALPVQFRGVISLAGGALWDTAWYGFLARMDLQGRAEPGRVIQWHHELGYPTQVLQIGDGAATERNQVSPRNLVSELICITTAMPEAFYLARWDGGRQQLEFVRRIGCLPRVASLNLSDDGWVAVGTDRATLWWQWDDAADAPPRKPGLHVAVTPGFFSGERLLALAAQYRLDDRLRRAPVPTVFNSIAGSRNEAERLGDPVPMAKPVGLSVCHTGKGRPLVYVADAATKQVWRTGLQLHDLRPDQGKWQPVRVAGFEPQAPSDIAALTDGRLLLADQGRIMLLEPDGDGFRVAWQLDRWGEEPSQRLGQRLRFAVHGAWMLVSDTDRHRLCWLDWAERKLLGQFGETDRPGDDAGHLDSPTLVSLRGTRAVVADAGNQRVLKLMLMP